MITNQIRVLVLVNNVITGVWTKYHTHFVDPTINSSSTMKYYFGYQSALKDKAVNMINKFSSDGFYLHQKFERDA